MNNTDVMSTTPTLVAPGFAQTHQTALRTLSRCLAIVGIGAVAAAAKKVSMPLGIPGHSAVLWLSVMIAGRAMVRRDGAALAIGICTALWGLPLALNNSFASNFGMYAGTGLALDIACRLPSIDIAKPWCALVAGVVAHMVKFVFLVGSALLSPYIKHFLLLGLAKSAVLHVLFGGVAGVLGLMAYGVVRRIPGVSDLA